MSQSRSLSLVEAGVNVVIGYGIALGTQALVFPLVGIKADLDQVLWVSLAFVLVSLARSYLLRRLFAHLSCDGVRRF